MGKQLSWIRVGAFYLMLVNRCLYLLQACYFNFSETNILLRTCIIYVYVHDVCRN